MGANSSCAAHKVHATVETKKAVKEIIPAAQQREVEESWLQLKESGQAEAVGQAVFKGKYCFT